MAMFVITRWYSNPKMSKKKRKSWKLGAEPTASATVFLILLTPGSGPLSYARMGKLHLADDLAMTELWPQLFVDDYFGG